MPELPEVEVICRGLAPHLEGQRLLSVSFGKQKLRLPMPTRKAIASVRGETVSSVKRRAKYIIITLENSAEIIIHLGMTGRLGLFPQGTPATKHDHASWLLANQMELRFNDTRRFGSVQISGPDDDHRVLFSNWGLYPFWESLTGDYLREKAHKRTLPIKNFLMDNRIVTGIGNIYASESLFKAGINPKRKAGSVSLARFEKLVDAIKVTLRDSIEQGGTTLKNFTGGDCQPGYFAQNLLVYGRAGDECPLCGYSIKQITQQARSTYYCSNCQR